SLLLGFDVDEHDHQQVVSAYLAARAELREHPLEGELDLLGVFADLSELSRNRPGSEIDAEPDSPVHSPREYFHSYLQSLDVDRAGVTESFREKLATVLAHYGVTSLDRTPELEAAVFRIFLAQQRMGTDVAVVSELLRQCLHRRCIGQPLPQEALHERAGRT